VKFINGETDKVVGSVSLGSLDPIGGFAVDPTTNTILVGGVNNLGKGEVAIVNGTTKKLRVMNLGSSRVGLE
jgi:DNA-binding beta-propeller fold protein YncE